MEPVHISCLEYHVLEDEVEQKICELCFNEFKVQREREKIKKRLEIQAKKMKLISGKSHSEAFVGFMVLTSVIRTVDAQLVCLSRDRMDLSGSTGIIVFQKANHITVANIGDSRAVMCDTKGNVVALSTDHKPSDPKEQQRIVDAGGFVTFNGVWRVAGVLATSRAFGDYPLKQRKFVTVDPDFRVYDVKESRPYFIILATDGLWDVFSNEDAVQFIRERLDEPHYGAKSLALQAYYRGSLDNITVMVINCKRKRALQRRFDDRQKKQLSEEIIVTPQERQSEGLVTDKVVKIIKKEKLFIFVPIPMFMNGNVKFMYKLCNKNI
ncbi:Protein phosphatase 1L [Bulinus truncatus]|nr:Protein phosphatase 1L [Bulinus truncatus]